MSRKATPGSTDTPCTRWFAITKSLQNKRIRHSMSCSVIWPTQEVGQYPLQARAGAEHRDVVAVRFDPQYRVG